MVDGIAQMGNLVEEIYETEGDEVASEAALRCDSAILLYSDAGNDFGALTYQSADDDCPVTVNGSTFSTTYQLGHSPVEGYSPKIVGSLTLAPLSYWSQGGRFDETTGAEL